MDDSGRIDGLLYENEAFQIRGAAFLEAAYQECLEVEFARRGVPFAAHRPLGLTYQG